MAAGTLHRPEHRHVARSGTRRRLGLDSRFRAIDGFNNIYLDPLTCSPGGASCQDVEDDCPHPKLAAIPAPCAPQALSFPSSDAASPVCRASPATWPHGSCGRSGHTPKSVRGAGARNGVWTHMYEVLHGSGGIARLLEFYPTFGPWPTRSYRRCSPAATHPRR